MDQGKAAALKRQLSEAPETELIVPLEQFFDGNDDLGSIGCNLIKHPGLSVFHEVLHRLASSAEVEGVYVEISELDPGSTCWPFSDRVFVAGTIGADAVRAVVGALQPDGVWLLDTDDVPLPVATRHPGATVAAIWWD